MNHASWNSKSAAVTRLNSRDMLRLNVETPAIAKRLIAMDEA